MSDVGKPKAVSAIVEYEVKCDGRVMTLEDGISETTLYLVGDSSGSSKEDHYQVG